MIRNQKAYFLTDSQIEVLMKALEQYEGLAGIDTLNLLTIQAALTNHSFTIESLMTENHQLRNRIQGLELEKAVNKLEKEEV